MKITYREAFATQLQKNLQAVSAILVEVPEGKDGTPPLSFVEGIIVSVEKATNKKITAKSPNWIFDRLWARLDGRLNPDRTSCYPPGTRSALSSRSPGRRHFGLFTTPPLMFPGQRGSLKPV